MRGCRAVLVVSLVALLQVGHPYAATQTQQHVLVLCTADSCDYRRVAMFQVGGRQSIRLVTGTADKLNAADVKGAREARLDQITGLYRDPRSAVFYAVDADGKPREIALPQKSSGKDVTPAGMWRTEALEYSDAPNGKAKTIVGADSFAYLLITTDSEQTVFKLLQHLLETSDADPRRPALIRGALQFSSKSPALQQWRESLLARIRGDLKRFEDQEGDPTTLAGALTDATRTRAIYLQVGDEAQDKALLDAAVAADDLFHRRVSVAEVLRTSGYWDEYWMKLKQLRLAKWSIPNMLANASDALNQISKLHQERSKQFSATGHLDRAFDEAELAARSSCQAAVNDEFYQDSVLQLVNHNKIASAVEYNGRDKLGLEQIVRELDQLDPSREQVILERLQRGERLDPNYLPLQLKKADFFDRVGRYGEALDVVRRIERRVPLDGRQLDEVLRLDGRITTNRTDVLQKALEETKKQLDAQKYEATLEAASKGLRADPMNVPLLYKSALASAFLRHNGDALRFIRTYLGDANIACAPAGEPEKLLELYQLMAIKQNSPESADSMPNWISGKRYRPSEVFYDPISLGFLQPVMRVSSDDGTATVFSREDRSFLVKSIATSMGNKKGAIPTGPLTVMFEAEPKYDRQALSMLEVGSRATSAGERTSYSLTYLNSPGVDPDLVFRFTGRQIARGWAGNPFFHPFIWSGFYVFDLTYDRLGRVATATPIREAAGSRTDPFSEPLQFTWDGDSSRLLTIKGTKSGYLREMKYKDNRLEEETISYPRGKGTITYEYFPDGVHLKSAKTEDNFYDKRERIALFDQAVSLR